MLFRHFFVSEVYREAAYDAKNGLFSVQVPIPVTILAVMGQKIGVVKSKCNKIPTMWRLVTRMPPLGQIGLYRYRTAARSFLISVHVPQLMRKNDPKRIFRLFHRARQASPLQIQHFSYVGRGSRLRERRLRRPKSTVNTNCGT